MCRIKNCKNHSEPIAMTRHGEDLCNTHYAHWQWYYLDIKYVQKKDEFGDYTNEYEVDDKGFPLFDLDRSVVGMMAFGRMVFPDLINKQYGTPYFHKQIALTLLEAISKEGPDLTYIDRTAAVQAFRGSSKSTYTTNLVPNYGILSHQVPDDLYPANTFQAQFLRRLRIVSEFIVVVMETGDMAAQAIEFAHDALLGNEYVRHYFGSVKTVKKADKDKVSEKFNTEEILTATLNTGKRCRIKGRGAGQRFRGMRSLNVRPRLLINDDIESESNTDTPEKRIKLNRWFSRNLLNTLDIPNAVLFTIGTALGMDTILYRQLKASDTRTVQINLLTLPNLEFGEPVWPERFSKSTVMKMYRKACEDNDEQGFWQEYFGIVATDEEKRFPKELARFADFHYETVNGYRCIVIRSAHIWSRKENKFTERIYDPPKIVNVSIGIGIDPAISESTVSNNTAISENFLTADGNFFILKFTVGKFAESDVFYDPETTNTLTLDEVCFDESKIKRKGTPEEVIRIDRKYPKVDIAVIGVEGQQEAWSNLLYKKANKNNASFSLLAFKSSKDKVIQSNALKRYWDAGKVYFHINYMNSPIFSKFEHFPYLNSDDEVDSVANAAREMSIPLPMALVEKVESNTHIPKSVQDILKAKQIAEQKSKNEQATNNILDNIINNI